MKKRRKVFHAPGSPMALSLQRFKYGWDTNPESMELRRKRAVEKRSRDCRRDREKLYKYFVFQQSFSEISPEILEHICYQIRNGKSGQSKLSKIKSIRRYLTLYGFIKYDSERDLYLNCYKIEHEEKERAEADQRKAEAQRIRDEAQRAERERLKAEPQQAVAKPPQAHRETQSQQVGLPRFNLRQLKLLRDSAVRSVSEYEIKSEKETDQAKLEKCLQFVEVYKRLVSKYELEISELEKYEAKLSV
jgi:hypothetical protein